MALNHKPLSAQDLKDIEGPQLASQFPVVFPNGAKFTVIEGLCNGCKQPIPREWVRGRVTRPIPSVAAVDAIGVCHSCRTTTRFFYRLHEDMSITGLTSKGRWARWKPRPSKLGMLLKALRWLFGR